MMPPISHDAPPMMAGLPIRAIMPYLSARLVVSVPARNRSKADTCRLVAVNGDPGAACDGIGAWC